ncbi:hypothetical protein BSU04_34715 [Caballeronia sordidicola]|uniref:Uncharacterized protein n=1 Tax=Caballeronia sordidicola TaxID=196367 RepID=A0A226WTX6_CABSO|nr:hypothetical protein BSU04_34715 [Caballeronia sordidicola]
MTRSSHRRSGLARRRLSKVPRMPVKARNVQSCSVFRRCP